MSNPIVLPDHVTAAGVDAEAGKSLVTGQRTCDRILPLLRGQTSLAGDETGKSSDQPQGGQPFANAE